LDYIIEGSMVTAVDFNLCQIALTELKKVAIMNIEFKEFFDIFSNSNMELLRELYPKKLRPHLTAPSATFWDQGVHTIKSFMYSGTSGNMSYILFRVLFPIFGLGFIRQELLKNTPKEELTHKISKYQYSIRAIAWLLDNIMLRGGCCFAGVPERQMALGLHRPNNLALVIERVFFHSDLVEDNYFYSGYFLGYYKPNNCPRYLREENYAKMRKYLQQGKLQLVHGTILQAIEQTTTPITVASLLDHMDWMTDRMINEEMTHLINKMDVQRGKIYWRTFADDVHSAPLNWLEPTRVGHADDEDSDDRVGMYWTTWIAHLKDVNVSFEERVDTKQQGASNLWTGLKVITYPFWKWMVSTNSKITSHANDMESFYKFQKNGYDSFREFLLHAKGPLMESFPLLKLGKGEKMVWVDVGGGTARNLEYFTVETIKKHFKAIYIVDISSSLLEVARHRVQLMGLTDIVHVIEHDFTLESVFKDLPKEGTVDVLTMSYSFSMIPDQQSALANATRLLKRKTGHLAIADFFLKGNYDDCLPPLSRRIRAIESSLHKAYFAMDHVHLLSDKQLVDLPELEVVWDRRFRGGVPFLPFIQPFHGVYVFKKK